jgi:hypothetical protein
MLGKFTLMTLLSYRRARAAYISWVLAKNVMAWMGFGIRGPGGRRTGSVVAVAMSSPPRAGTAKISVRRSTLSVAGASRYSIAAPAAATEPRLWLLGSSLYSAPLAAATGLPYVFAHSTLELLAKELF